jgi:DNA-binding MarR family transcriptional regulator
MDGVPWLRAKTCRRTHHSRSAGSRLVEYRDLNRLDVPLDIGEIDDISTIENRNIEHRNIRMAFSSRIQATRCGDPKAHDRHSIVDLGPEIPPVRRVAGALARRFNQICVALVADVVVGADLTPLQFGVLAHLNRRDGRPGIDQNSLGARIGVERSHASLLVDGLEKLGLVHRQVNGDDRRGRILQLTPKGEKLYDQLYADVFATHDRVLEPLSARERVQFIEMLIRIIKHNSAYARPGAGRRKRGQAQSAPSKK